MRITVRPFARFREIVGSGSLSVELADGSTVADLLVRLANEYPDLLTGAHQLIVAVNQEFASGDMALHQGDEVAVFPPVSGGRGSEDVQSN